jgi:predicted transcriptional regulator
MPYERFRMAARELRHDIDRLRQMFHTSFEQTCHRLSTLQRPRARGIPVYFCRVDMAGNITKRHSATRMNSAASAGPALVDRPRGRRHSRPHPCPAGRNARRHALCLAGQGTGEAFGSYYRPPRRYAVALGCEAAHAAEFIYADGLNLANDDAVTRIGASCRICPRDHCDQRAFPPSDKAIVVDPLRRDLVPYHVVEP